MKHSANYPWQIWVNGALQGGADSIRGSKSGTVDLGDQVGVSITIDCHAGLNFCRGKLNVYQVECAASNCGAGEYRSSDCTDTADRVCTSCPANSYVNSAKTGCTCAGNWKNAAGKPNDCSVCKAGWDINHQCTRCLGDKYGASCSSATHCLVTSNRGTCNHQSCFGTSGNGQCSSCSQVTAGRICEHNVCADSAAANLVQDTWSASQPPSDFDWTLYNAEDIEVVQVKENDGDFGLEVRFRPISPETSSFALKVDGVQRRTESATAECDNADSRAVFGLVGVDKSVGDTVSVCVRANWRTSSLYPPTAWGSSTTLINTAAEERGNPEACVADYTIKYQTHVVFTASDLPGSSTLEGAAVTYSFSGQSGSPQTTALTDANGQLDMRAPLAGFTGGATTSDMVIHSVTKQGSTFKVCPHAPPCIEGELADSSGYTFQTEHLNAAARPVYLVDVQARSIQGKVDFDFFGQSCGVFNVSLIARAPGSSGEDGVLGVATTDEGGVFSLAVPVNSLVSVELGYMNHTFGGTAVGGVAADLLSSVGLVVSDNLTGVDFTDLVTETLTLTTGVTECKFDMGPFTLKLKPRNCLVGGTQLEAPLELSIARDNGDLDQSEWVFALPAQEFNLGLEDFVGVEGIAGLSMEAQFLAQNALEESRQRDMRTEAASLQFLFQPAPEVVTEVVLGLEYPESFPSSCNKAGAKDAFDIVLSGPEPDAEWAFTGFQRYPSTGEQCWRLPPGSLLRVASHLDPDNAVDPCGHLNLHDGLVPNGGCLVPFQLTESQGQNASRVHVFASVGQPIKEGASVAAFTRVLELAVSNIDAWGGEVVDGVTEGVEFAQPDLTCLILGQHIITEDSLVTYFGEKEEPLPLVYLYGVPVGEQSSFGSHNLVRMSLDVQMDTLTSSYKVKEGGGGAQRGVKFAYSWSTFGSIGQSNSQFMVGGRGVRATTTKHAHLVQTSLTSETLELKSPPSEEGKDADMVLLVGSISKYQTSVFVNFNLTTCEVTTLNSAVWGTAMDSLLFYSRSDCEREVDKLQHTIRANDDTIDALQGSTDAADLDLVAAANATRGTSHQSISKWQRLFDDWEQDYLESTTDLQYRVDLRGKVADAQLGNGNHRLVFGAGQVTVRESVTETNTSQHDYESWTNHASFEGGASGEFLIGAEAEIMMGLIKTKGEVGPAFASDWHHTTTTSMTNYNTATESSPFEVETFFKEVDTGDQLCVEMFKSKHSGTLITKVCGGQTRCPWVPGTDPRESLSVGIIERPQLLQEDRGRIVLEVSTEGMILEGDEMTIVIELDSRSATFPVSFNIGSASLNQPLEFTLQKGEKTPINIYFNRLDPDLSSMTTEITVRSKCDVKISRTVEVKARWSSACPVVEWAGNLADADATFALTAAEHSLVIAASNPGDVTWREAAAAKGVEIEVSVWAKLYDSVYADWVRLDLEDLALAEDDFGNAQRSLEVDAAKLYMREGGRYLLELRTLCTQQGRYVGDTRSGSRFGVLDTAGPEFVGWTSPNRVALPSHSVRVAIAYFSEPLDCTNPLLKATLRTVITNSSEPAVPEDESVVVKDLTVHCGAGARSLFFVLHLESDEEVAALNTVVVRLDLAGVIDVYGNPMQGSESFSLEGGASRRRALEGDEEQLLDLTLPFQLPDLGEEALKDIPADQRDLTGPALADPAAAVAQARKQLLPKRVIQSAYHVAGRSARGNRRH